MKYVRSASRGFIQLTEAPDGFSRAVIRNGAKMHVTLDEIQPGDLACLGDGRMMSVEEFWESGGITELSPVEEVHI